VTASLASAARDRRERVELAESADRERRDRLAVTEREVTVALKEAGALQDQKKWSEALEAAKRAQGLLAEDSSDELRGRVRELRKDLEMVLRLEGKWLPRTVPGKEDPSDNVPAEAAYAQAFRDYGIDVESLEPTEAAQRVRARAIRFELTVALDHWANLFPKLPPGTGKGDDTRRKRLFAVARAADPDEWRNQVRDALEQRNAQALHDLAASPRIGELPLRTLSLLGGALLGEDSVRVLRQAQQKYPDDFGINFQLGWSLDGGPKATLDEVVRFWTVARALRPRNIPVHMWLGQKLVEQGKLDEAIAVYRKAVELSPDDATLQLDLARYASMNGKLDVAVTAYRRVIELQPENAVAYYELGRALGDQGKTDEAVAAYRKAVGLKPDYADALAFLLERQAEFYFQLGHALYRQGKLDEAVAAYRKAIGLKPDYVDAHHELGNLLGCQGKVDEAIASYRKAFGLSPDDATLHLNLARVAGMNGKLDVAITAYRRVIELQPNNAEAHNELGHALSRQGKLDEAVAAYRKAIGLKPGLAVAHHELGYLLSRQGKVDEAIASYRKALELNPGNAEFNLNLARHALQNGKLDVAITAYRRVIELQPNNAEAHNELGHALSRQGKLDEAVAAHRKAIGLKPDYADAHHALGHDLAKLSLNLLQQQKYPDAEPLLRECLTIRMKHMPDDWLTFNTRSMLGAALSGQRNFTEAEPLLVQGYEGMKQREAKILTEGKINLTAALERLVGMYEATGQEEKAAAWRKKLEEREADLKKP
jgi:tetratricopeptide (TPR) repeat protein